MSEELLDPVAVRTLVAVAVRTLVAIEFSTLVDRLGLFNNQSRGFYTSVT